MQKRYTCHLISSTTAMHNRWLEGMGGKASEARALTERARTHENTIGVCSSDLGRCLMSFRKDGPMLAITYKHPV